MTQLTLDIGSEAGQVAVEPYRYLLWRRWSAGPAALFCMLNPSTATDVELDPTVRRCVGYVKRWGYPALEVVNLFALRSTDPRALKPHPDPVGPQNDLHILDAARRAKLVVCAWGNGGRLRGRGLAVWRMLDTAGIKTHCLRVSAEGHPWHPLYLPNASEPMPFTMENR